MNTYHRLREALERGRGTQLSREDVAALVQFVNALLTEIAELKFKAEQQQHQTQKEAR